MKSPVVASRQSWCARNRMMLLTVAIVGAYAFFIQWFWGWSSILEEWAHVGVLPIVAALLLLTSTYFLRTWRIYDYFPRETSGRFRALFRVTQVHNLLNIMLPFRTGETSFPVLMRTEFGIPIARGTSALFVMRLLDLHALLAAAGIGFAAASQNRVLAWAIWTVFLLLPVAAFATRKSLLRIATRLLPAKAQEIVAEIENGLPSNAPAFARAWAMTVINWLVKVLVLAWSLRLMGVFPISASFGGALGGELSSVLPVHAPGGVGTYPAGITAGAVAFGASGEASALATLAQASINAHLLIIVSALTGTAISLPFGRRQL
ncbi:flippase-like domain-containing protein [Rhizobium grahamii]|uniref:Flippase-like domain-containing protein n=1 Tax=Rhizobium grahamii TaxID=1120045 RepID=A0A5Q0C6L0_9HYPH|nr:MULTISPECIES: lysylphosphatidylglycerol synthase transmembrane domain-containing protein [Rhizobium]QFY59541.1 flippase-like domain-containing protein [Rhizobium grahamii]QRM47936.1 flippase-like domain-containing protein [Rhizobium sp. BG6]